ncbi:MAG TPA: Cof-type HAD-IIB family hydrolase [Terriglobales bacterium]|nr:Cof-type HAD-IIB family hydrolase [Terriglobales bacterium]
MSPSRTGRPEGDTIRLVVSDVDGTLVTKDKTITAAALEAIRSLRAKGIRFTIISSRPPQALKVIGDVIGLTDPVPAFNGGLVVDADLTTIRREKLLEPIVVERLLEEVPRTGIDVWVYTDTHWFVRNPKGPYVEHEQHAVKFDPTVVPDFKVIPSDRVAKIVGVSENFDAVAAAEKKIQQAFAGAVSALRSQNYYLDITHPAANKAEGILLLAELLDIPPSSIATIGDMQNDVCMFQQSGMSIAMGNATADIQSEADYVTSSNEEEGFARAMERYILNV